MWNQCATAGASFSTIVFTISRCCGTCDHHKQSHHFNVDDANYEWYGLPTTIMPVSQQQLGWLQLSDHNYRCGRGSLPKKPVLYSAVVSSPSPLQPIIAFAHVLLTAVGITTTNWWCHGDNEDWRNVVHSDKNIKYHMCIGATLSQYSSTHQSPRHAAQMGFPGIWRFGCW